MLFNQTFHCFFTASVKMDQENNTPSINVKELTLNLTLLCHYSLPVKGTRKALVTKVLYAEKRGSCKQVLYTTRTTENSPE